MNTSKLITVAKQIQNSLDREALTELGRAVGFTRRLREVTPHRVAVATIATFASQKVESIADILRAFNALAGTSVQYKPFHNQLRKDEFPVFMEGVFKRLLERSVSEVLKPLSTSVLSGVKDIWIQDGSSFAVHDDLRKHFPGRFTKVSPAAVELHATMSVWGDQVVRVVIAPDTQGERDFLPEPKCLRDILILADRGYADIEYCDEVQREGGRFVIRFKGNVNARVVGCWIKGRPRRFLPGSCVQEVLLALGKKSVDFDVEWTRHGRAIQIRLVVLWNPVTKEHVVLATNLPRETVMSDTVAVLYRLRWQIELLFKEWKSYANLHAFNTEIPALAKGLIWAALTAALLKRFLAHATEYVCGSVPISTRRTAMALAQHLPQTMRTLLTGRGFFNQLRGLLQYLQTNARRAHPARDLERGRLRAGLAHAALAAQGA